MKEHLSSKSPRFYHQLQEIKRLSNSTFQTKATMILSKVPCVNQSIFLKILCHRKVSWREWGNITSNNPTNYYHEPNSFLDFLRKKIQFFIGQIQIISLRDKLLLISVRMIPKR